MLGFRWSSLRWMRLLLTACLVPIKIKHGSGRRISCHAGRVLLGWTHLWGRRIANVVGSDLSGGETNSAGPGYNLWGVSQGFTLARWGENRGQSNGGNALWKRHTVAPSGSRPREAGHPRTVRIPPTKIVTERRRPTGGIPCGLEEAPLVTHRGREAARETESAAGA